MAFSGISYFAGVGTAFVAVAIGFAGGALVTTSTVQPPNRLERVTSNAPVAAPAPPSAMTEQPNVASAPGSAPSEAPATPRAVPTQKTDSQTAQKPASSEPAAVKTDTARSDTATNNDAPGNNAQRAPTVGSSARNQPAPSARSEDAALPKNERTGTRSNDWRKEAYRKRAEDRKAEDRKLDDRQADDRKTDERRADDRRFIDRRRRQDLDEATNTVRQMRRDNPPDQVIVERDGPPRYVEERAPRSRFFESDDDTPRPRGEGPRPFGFFGNN